MSVEEYTAWFNSADVDGSGELNYKELESALSKKGYDSDRIKKMFKVMDISGDEKVSLTEYLKTMGVEPQSTHGASALKRICWSFDKNGDGTIEKSELEAVFESMGKYITPEQADRLLKSYDADGDGKISYDELCVKMFGKHCD